MAELVLKVGAGATYQDGDIVVALNRRRIRCVHAQHICHPVLAGFTRDGLRPDGLAKQFRERTAEYRFTRVSHTEVQRLNLRTSVTDTLGRNPNARGEAIAVARFIARRVAHPRHCVFGTPGAEQWYGGRSFLTHPDLDVVWSDIETLSAFRESDHALWPVTRTERAHCLCVAVADFDDARADQLTASTLDVDGHVILKRMHYVEYATDTRITDRASLSTIRDRSVELDIRQAMDLLTDADIRTR